MDDFDPEDLSGAIYDVISVIGTLRHYHSKHFMWDDDMDKEFRTRIEGELSIARWRTRLKAGVENIKNYTYFNQEAKPEQNSGSIQVLSASLNQDFKLGIFHLDNEVTWQKSSDQTVLPLPDLVPKNDALGDILHESHEVLAWLEVHPDAAAKVEQCSINLGAATLTDEDFSDYFANRLRRSPLRPEQFYLEITETSVVRDMTRTRRFIQRMRDLGCRFALDDFGTGFCSFSYLRDLDVDYLKIDGSFVRDIDQSGLSEAVVRSITEIAHLLGKRAVGEQAETELQLDHLRALGVDYAQGYVFRRPQPIDAFFGLAEPA